MAYVLGFTCADGNVYKTTLAWELSKKHISDRDLLVRINDVMNSTYPIEERAHSFRLRISNPVIVYDLNKLGVPPNKCKILKFPKVPDEYVRDFIRGFFDGDGWVGITSRGREEEFCVGFSNGSYSFMKTLADLLKSNARIKKIHLRKQVKTTKNDVVSTVYSIEFYSGAGYKLLKFLFDDMNSDDLFLMRKFERQEEARKIHEEILRRKLIPRFWKGSNEALKNLLKEKMHKMKPVEISHELGVNLSTVYRWLDKTGARKFSKRGSVQWQNRIREGRNKRRTQ